MKNDSGFKTVKLHSADIAHFRNMVALFSEVFEEPLQGDLSDEYIRQLLANNDFIAIAAIAGDKVAGGVTAYVMQQYNGEYAEAYIYDIAVQKEQQRKGIGKMLLEALAAYCRKNNISLMFVEAHEADSHAIDFYRSVGGKPEKVVHFNIEVI